MQSTRSSFSRDVDGRTAFVDQVIGDLSICVSTWNTEIHFEIKLDNTDVQLIHSALDSY